MAAIAKSGTPSPCSLLIPPQFRLTGLVVGEDIAVGDACYVKSDGKIWRSDGSAVAAAAKVHGYAMTAGKVATGDAVTLGHGFMWNYGSGMTPGTSVFLSGATLGALADAASTGGTAPIGFVFDATRIFLKQSAY